LTDRDREILALLAKRATHECGLVYTAVEIEAANGWFRQVPLHVVKGAGQHADAPGALPPWLSHPPATGGPQAGILRGFTVETSPPVQVLEEMAAVLAKYRGGSNAF
jgi:hypothetical protein